MLRPALLFLAALAAPAAAASPPPLAPGFTTTQSSSRQANGGRVAEWTLKRDRRDDGAIRLVMAIVPRNAARVEVRPVLKEGPAGPTYRSGPCQDALAVVNGSFFYQDAAGYRPMGLVRVDGRTVQGPSPRTSGGFLTSDGRTVRIVPKATPAPAQAARFAVESAPILIQEGRNGMRSDDRQRHDRVAVGITEDGDLIAVGAFGPSQATVSLWEFEKLARAAALRQGERIDDLIALDGGPSAHLYLPGGPGREGVLHGWKGRIYTPNVVCIGARPR